MGRRRAVVVVAALLIEGCGGAGPSGCTLVGCASGIYVHVGELGRTMPKAASVTLCIDGRCKTVPAHAANVVGMKGRMTGSHRVTVTVKDRHGRTLVAGTLGDVVPHRVQPNGGGSCGPTCYVASLELLSRTSQLVPFGGSHAR